MDLLSPKTKQTETMMKTNLLLAVLVLSIIASLANGQDPIKYETVVKDGVTYTYKCTAIYNVVATITADNTFTLYRNNEALLTGTEWTKSYTVTFTAKPDDVIYVQVYNAPFSAAQVGVADVNNPAAVMGTLKVNGKAIDTNTTWKCIEGYQFGDISTWPAAVDYGSTLAGAGAWGTNSPIKSNTVRFIWNKTNQYIGGAKGTCAYKL